MGYHAWPRSGCKKRGVLRGKQKVEKKFEKSGRSVQFASAKALHYHRYTELSQHMIVVLFIALVYRNTRRLLNPPRLFESFQVLLHVRLLLCLPSHSCHRPSLSQAVSHLSASLLPAPAPEEHMQVVREAGATRRLWSPVWPWMN